MDSIGECVACICKRLEIMDAKIDNLTVAISDLNTQEIVNKIDIVVAGEFQTRQQLNEIQGVIYSIHESLKCECECECEPTPEVEP